MKTTINFLKISAFALVLIAMFGAFLVTGSCLVILIISIIVRDFVSVIAAFSLGYVSALGGIALRDASNLLYDAFWRRLNHG